MIKQSYVLAIFTFEVGMKVRKLRGIHIKGDQ